MLRKNYMFLDSKMFFYCEKYLNHTKLMVIWRKINDILSILAINGQLTIYKTLIIDLYALNVPS